MDFVADQYLNIFLKLFKHNGEKIKFVNSALTIIR